MTLLELEDIHTYYGEAHILQGVSLAVKPGEVVTLIGRNGAGKTTTLRSIMGIVAPKRGCVRFGAEDITRLETHRIAQRGIAYVPEDRRVLPNLTVLEKLRLGLLGAGRTAAVASTTCWISFRRSASGSRTRAASSRAASSRCSRSRAA